MSPARSSPTPGPRRGRGPAARGPPRRRVPGLRRRDVLFRRARRRDERRGGRRRAAGRPHEMAVPRRRAGHGQGERPPARAGDSRAGGRAERGQGARLNGIPVQVSGAENGLDAMLCPGFPYDVHQTGDEVVGLFGDFVSSARAVRRLGSAALDLCYVAAGRFDGFWEQRLQPWDMAAGALLVEEAGGRVTDMEGQPFSSRTGSIIASNGRVHEEMERIILSRHSTRTGR